MSETDGLRQRAAGSEADGLRQRVVESGTDGLRQRVVESATGSLRQRLAELISTATGGMVRADDVLSGASILNLGVDSLGMLRLVDAIEQEWGAEVDFDDLGHRIQTVDDLVELVSSASRSD